MTLFALSAATGAACGAFSGNDSGGADKDAGSSADGGADAPADAGAAIATDARSDDDAATTPADAGPDVFDACVTSTFTPVADTYFFDSPGDGGCNDYYSEGPSTTLRVKDMSPPEMTALRFQLDGATAASLMSATAVLTFNGASCTGTCVGSVHPMRSDWDEGVGIMGDGADFCRARTMGSAGWGPSGTTNTAISSADYGSSVGTLTLNGTTWSSNDLAGATLVSQLTGTHLISFFVDMPTTGALVAASREANGGKSAPTLVVRSCK